MPAVRIGISPGERSEKEEFLRCRVRDSREDDCADSYAKIELDPDADIFISLTNVQGGLDGLPRLAEII